MSLEEAHTAFIEWSRSQGIYMNGVAPANIPDRRLGMVTTRTIYAGETIIEVPCCLTLTIDSIPSTFIKKFPDGTSTQAILAAFLTNANPTLLQKWDLWRGVWPSRKDFEEALPFFWKEDPNSIFYSMSTDKKLNFPPSVSGTWTGEEAQNAWRSVISVFPRTDWETFSYNWHILNTRSFYYVAPGKSEPDDWNDAIALVPFADYFKHDTEAPCNVSFDDQTYMIKATRQFEKGEEIFISYGSHTNDFLFVEYGFLLNDNPSDAIYLDDIIIKDLTEAQKEELHSLKSFGGYKVTSSGVCERTRTAACIKQQGVQKLIDRSNARDRVEGSVKVSNILRGWITVYLDESKSNINTLEEVQLSASPVDKGRIGVLLRRWYQIQALCEDALKAIVP